MKSKPVMFKPLSKREIKMRLVALRKVFAQVDADPELKAAIRRWTKTMSR